jgi:hypothetical protein
MACLPSPTEKHQPPLPPYSSLPTCVPMHACPQSEPCLTCCSRVHLATPHPPRWSPPSLPPSPHPRIGTIAPCLTRMQLPTARCSPNVRTRELQRRRGPTADTVIRTAGRPTFSRGRPRLSSDPVLLPAKRGEGSRAAVLLEYLRKPPYIAPTCLPSKVRLPQSQSGQACLGRT